MNSGLMDAREGKPGWSLSGRVLSVILLMAGLSLLLKLAVLGNRWAAYMAADLAVINPDERGYIARAMLGEFGISPGSHWLWEYLNAQAYALVGSPGATFLTMCFVNIAVSLSLPFLSFPLLRHLADSNRSYERMALGYSALVLFWPSAVAYSASNMKDMLLAFFFIGVLSVISGMDGKSRGGGNIGVHGPLLLILIYLIFSLRAYFAAFILVAAMLYFLWGRGGWGRKAVFLATLFTIAFVSGIYGTVREFLDFENNWLFNAEALARTNEEAMQDVTGLAKSVNNTPVALAGGLAFFFLDPLPNLQVETVTQGMLVLQSFGMQFLWLPFLLGLYALRKHKLAVYLYTHSLLVVAFYSAAQMFSGSRQRFATFDLILLLALVYFVVQGFREFKGQKWIPAASVTGGLLLNILFIFISSRAAL